MTAQYHLTDLLDKNAVIRNLTQMFHRISSNPRMCTLIQANDNAQLIYSFFRSSMMEQFYDLRGANAVPCPEEDLVIHYVAASGSAILEWWVRNNNLLSPEHLAQCIYCFHNKE